MDRSEAEDYIYRSYLKADKHWSHADPDSARRNPAYTKEVLNRTAAPAVLVTGSKGKGSVSMMVSTLLKNRLRVGLFTSPHISTFNERFRIDNVPISDEEFSKTVSEIKKDLDSIEGRLPLDRCISPIGIQAAVALRLFNAHGTQFNIFECGKGARYDDVNNLQRRFSAITPIFLEHTRELGPDIKSIAGDKSHIITGSEKAVFVSKQSPEAMEILRERADRMNVELRTYGADFEATNISDTPEGVGFDVSVGNRTFRNLMVPLHGKHQAENCALALAICLEICEMEEETVRSSLSTLEWPGRLETIHLRPTVILDACINRVSCQSILDSLSDFGKMTVIIGIPDDKDYLGVAETILPLADRMILTRSSNPHYIFSDTQRSVLERNGIMSECTGSLREALNRAGIDAPILIIGTTSLISDAKKLQEEGWKGLFDDRK